MSKLSFLTPFIVLAAFGCTSPDGDYDTSPPKPLSTEDRAAAIEKSDMTPEQKQAALNYLNQGQAGSQKIKENFDKEGKQGGQ
jgi:hypothetical protein